MKRRNPNAVYSLSLGEFTGQFPNKPIEGWLDLEGLADGRIRFCITGNNAVAPLEQQPVQATVGWFFEPGQARDLARMLLTALGDFA